jgi:hypothetical protein
MASQDPGNPLSAIMATGMRAYAREMAASPKSGKKRKREARWERVACSPCHSLKAFGQCHRPPIMIFGSLSILIFDPPSTLMFISVVMLFSLSIVICGSFSIRLLVPLVLSDLWQPHSPCRFMSSLTAACRLCYRRALCNLIPRGCGKPEFLPPKRVMRATSRFMGQIRDGLI